MKKQIIILAMAFAISSLATAQIPFGNFGKKSKSSTTADDIEARRMPAAVMQNAAIEKDFMALISYDFQEEVIPLRAVIAESNWNILRDDYNNAITGRIIAGYVAIKVKRNDRCFYKKITIYQPYTGGGKYGLSKYFETRVSSDLLEIKYDNVMK